MNFKKIKNRIKNNKTIYKYCVLFVSFLESIPYRVFYVLFRFFPVKNNKIVICSYYGKGYGDSPKYIVNELLTRKKNLDIVWLVNNIEMEIPEGIRKVKYNSIRSFYELTTAKIWIDNCRKPYYVLKRKNQFYLQTWHSSLRLKKIEKDVINELSPKYIKNAKSDSKKMDLLTVGCKFSEDMYDRVFWYNGEKLCCGTPRCDLFFDEKIKAELNLKIRNKYNLKNKKIILYAPTFKKNYETDDVSINFEDILKKINLSDEYVFLVRLHPISKKIVKEDKNVLNFTDYPDIQELITICDFFITDYSGCCFDAMFADKPCVLYTPDLDLYLKNERSLCFDFDKLPFQKIMKPDDLVNAILNFDYDKYLAEINNFKLEIGSYEKGIASSQIADVIENVINKK